MTYFFYDIEAIKLIQEVVIGAILCKDDNCNCAARPKRRYSLGKGDRSRQTILV